MNAGQLIGRDAELAMVADLIDGLSAGRPFVLSVRGESGAGRSSLLAAARDLADQAGLQVLAARGIDGPSAPPLSALSTVLRPLPAAASALPSASSDLAGQADAAFAALTAAAVAAPTLILLDDADRFDPDSLRVLDRALGAIGVEPVGAIAVGGAAAGPLDRVATHSLPLPGLARASLVELAGATAPCTTPVAEAVADWAGGSPLLTVELIRSLSADERDGTAPLPTVPRPTVLVVDRLQRELDDLPATVQRALVVAAADRSGSAAVIARALVELGEPASALDEAEASGLVRVDGDQVSFRQALVRPLAYALVASASRRAAHRALASALVEPDQAEERVDQLLRSTLGPDEGVAELLDLVAAAQLRRGAASGAGNTWAEAARLSADTDGRTRRLLDAARAHHDAGDTGAAIAAASAAAQLGAPGAADLLEALTAAEAAGRSDAAPDAFAGVLSAAEIRVAESVASGLTNRQAADALFISAKTVDFHLQSIYRKLAIRSRAELATRVATRGANR